VVIASPSSKTLHNDGETMFHPASQKVFTLNPYDFSPNGRSGWSRSVRLGHSTRSLVGQSKDRTAAPLTTETQALRFVAGCRFCATHRCAAAAVRAPMRGPAMALRAKCDRNRGPTRLLCLAVEPLFRAQPLGAGGCSGDTEGGKSHSRRLHERGDSVAPMRSWKTRHSASGGSARIRPAESQHSVPHPDSGVQFVAAPGILASKQRGTVKQNGCESFRISISDDRVFICDSTAPSPGESRCPAGKFDFTLGLR
jgi:hypothetical protein